MVGHFAVSTARRLMNHHPGIRQQIALTLGAAAEQEGAHASLQSDTNRLDVRLDILHSIINCQAIVHHAARAVNVKLDVLFGIFVG